MKTRSSNRRRRNQLPRSTTSRIVLVALGALASCGWVANAQYKDPDFKAPWPEAEKKGLWPKSSPPDSKTTTTTTAPAAATPAAQPTAAAQPAVADQSSEEGLIGPFALAGGAEGNQASGGDLWRLFHGAGRRDLAIGVLFGPVWVCPPRLSAFRGQAAAGCQLPWWHLSYSYGQSWYVDVGYAQGDSSGQVDANLGGGFTPPSDFTIDETGYQAYIRYVPKSLRGKRLSAYFRVGVTNVDAKTTDTLVDPLLGFYQETVKATDLLGNAGFGVGYLCSVPTVSGWACRPRPRAFMGIAPRT